MRSQLRIAETHWSLGRPRRAGGRSALERSGLFVHLDVEGYAGVGEASPLPGYSDETLAEARSALTETVLPSRVARDRADFERGCERFARLPASARFAIELAWLDASARAAGRTMPAFLGAARSVTLVPALVIEDEEDLLSLGMALGVDARAVKLKVGPPMADGLDRARRVRRMSGDAVELRLDANQRLGWEDWHAARHPLRDLGPVLLEEPAQPVAPFDPRVVDACSGEVRIALDESLRRLQDDALEAWLASPALGALGLKPSLLGLARVLHLAALAGAHGKRTILSHTHEGLVGRRALDALAGVFSDPSPGLFDPGREPTRTIVLDAAGGLVEWSSSPRKALP